MPLRIERGCAAELRQYAYGSLSQPVFAIALKRGEDIQIRSVGGQTIQTDSNPEPYLLAPYDQARTAALLRKQHSSAEDIVSIAVRYAVHNKRGWFFLPVETDLAIQSQAKPFTPLAVNTPPSTAFPINSIPEPYRAYVQAASGSYQVDPAMVSCCLLGVLSAIFQRCGFAVRVNPDWLEPVNLFLICTASPSERKSPVLRDAVSQLVESIEAWNERQADQIEWQRSRIDILKKRIEGITAALSKAKSKVSEGDLRQAQAELKIAQDEQMTPVTWLVDDTTPEALALVMQANKESAALLSGEGGSILGILAGRYSAPGTGANLDLFLKSYSVEPTIVHRVGRQTVSLRHPRLTVLLMAQPSLLQEFIGNDSFSGRGLTARFLFAFPGTRVGQRSFYSNPVPSDIRAAYENQVRQLADMALNWEQQDTELTVSAEALGVLSGYHAEVEPLRPEMSDSLQAWSGKAEGNIIRIAALLYLASHNGAVGEIDAQTMTNAVEIGRYFQVQAEYALGISKDSPARKDALLILKKLRSPSYQKFRSAGFITRRDLYLKLRGKPFKSATDMDAGLKELEKNGYLILVDGPKGDSKGGRPSPRVYFSEEFLDSLGEE